jgi:hypothetical protein
VRPKKGAAKGNNVTFFEGDRGNNVAYLKARDARGRFQPKAVGDHIKNGKHGSNDAAYLTGRIARTRPETPSSRLAIARSYEWYVRESCPRMWTV